MNKGTLYIISAPSGAGKSTLLKAYLDQEKNEKGKLNSFFSISHTTRKPREGEKNAVHYHFIENNLFESLIKQDEFIEYAQVFDHYYGTSKTMIESHLNQGQNVFLDIDWQGAEQVRQKLPEAVSIFILPPSIATLEERLRQRGLDDEATIQKRMAQAMDQISHYKAYEYTIVNAQFELALRDFNAILLAESLKTAKRKDIFE